jgi:hypothetical protein
MVGVNYFHPETGQADIQADLHAREILQLLPLETYLVPSDKLKEGIR